MRHDLVTKLSKHGLNMISERNALDDVGASTESISKNQDITSLITANAKRVEEALRVIEEMAKLPELSQIFNSAEFQKARFSTYQLEQTLLSRVLRRDKVIRLKGLYVILDTQILPSKDVIKAADLVIKGGARVIQLRDKLLSKHDLLIIAGELKHLCSESDVLFIVNDYLDIALAAKADGIHIGQSDMPLSVIRKELPFDKIAGCSIETKEQAVAAEFEGADYVALGSIFPTQTKHDVSVVGLEMLRQIKQSVSIPLVAIGGINKANINDVISAGADAAAVISSVLATNDIKKAVKELVERFE
jgi:thiamine-phosphate pyrophosphorylase